MDYNEKNQLVNNRFRFEKGEQDFPFYDSQPVTLSWGSWVTWVVITIGTFFIFSGLLLEPIIKLFHLDGKLKVLVENPNTAVAVNYVFLGVSLLLIFATYWVVSGHRWNALFKKLTLKEFGSSALIGILGMSVTTLYSKFVITDLFHIKTVADISTKVRNDTPLGVVILNALEVVIQLIAEEMWAIVPFLFVLMLCYKNFSMSRKSSILVAWLISSLIFGLYHIPAYDGNIAQAILVIGVSRIILTFSYLRYKNIWASYTTHIFWDMIPILSVLIQGIAGK